ncbi:extracellular solute-binding protein [Termitidicoccus mucosus]|uniref:ABC transporter substrate-binding protein n=1 Tax=Termitidicoccus mucosus TaxID=1184151 RepID=A0A178IDK2_9BACT|nr:hypothetical protein AW736_18690 [Opitutaceae bacterium TSB47]
MTRLSGITWNHTRGYTPLVACAQRFAELHPGVEISWTRRSLLEFGEMPVEWLVDRFDLLVIDHPFIGAAARSKLFLPLDERVPSGIRAEWQDESVGKSGGSYAWEDRVWAAPVDAACPVAVWRPDLLARASAEPPRDWEGMMALAAKGLVLIPGVPTDAIHHFYMLCHALGTEPCACGDGEVAPAAVMRAALEELARLYAAVPEACRTMNPIAVHEALAAVEATAAYCPFAFGYSNYSRPGYAARRLRAGLPPAWKADGGGPARPLVTTLGGTGLAVSARSAHADWAARFAGFVSSGETQGGLYWQAGGQPAHRQAWRDGAINAATDDFFAATLPALDRAWLRPRFPGYLHFQDNAAPVVHAAACGETEVSFGIERLNTLWREARAIFYQHENKT